METNEIERQQPRVQDTSQNRLRSHASVTDDSERNEVISKQQMCQFLFNSLGMNVLLAVWTALPKLLEVFIMTCKFQSANSFIVSKVSVQAITCETTVEQLCPFYKPATHCPRVYCPHNCMQANPHYARVIGSRIYSDVSSICRTAVHAGVIRNEGGFVDVMPVDKRRMYIASFQNGIFSESLQNPPGGKAFRVFAVI
ncbi:hypothetical protein lerEdw1_008947 [Lerista edwardsae]|nr:hypothetical protein lerEdw1_008947 [Lerista edwardsae]